MASRSPQTQAKRARELALKERRERKRAKKEEARQRAAGDGASTSGGSATDPGLPEATSETAATAEREEQ
jgi:hypothetical protein